MAIRTRVRVFFFCFFFNDPATTEIYTLSLHDALPIFRRFEDLEPELPFTALHFCLARDFVEDFVEEDRKSTRLNSSHMSISYAVFCLKKKKMHKQKV